MMLTPFGTLLTFSSSYRVPLTHYIPATPTSHLSLHCLFTLRALTPLHLHLTHPRTPDTLSPSCVLALPFHPAPHPPHAAALHHSSVHTLTHLTLPSSPVSPVPPPPPWLASFTPPLLFYLEPSISGSQGQVSPCDQLGSRVRPLTQPLLAG